MYSVHSKWLEEKYKLPIYTYIERSFFYLYIIVLKCVIYLRHLWISFFLLNFFLARIYFICTFSTSNSVIIHANVFAKYLIIYLRNIYEIYKQYLYFPLSNWLKKWYFEWILCGSSLLARSCLALLYTMCVSRCNVVVVVVVLLLLLHTAPSSAG